MKWILLSVALVGILPFSHVAAQSPARHAKIWMLVGFLAFEHGPLHTYMAFDSWAGLWSGYIQGAEISLLDLIMFAIYLSLPRAQQPLPFLYPMAFYFLAALHLGISSKRTNGSPILLLAACSGFLFLRSRGQSVC